MNMANSLLPSFLLKAMPITFKSPPEKLKPQNSTLYLFQQPPFFLPCLLLQFSLSLSLLSLLISPITLSNFPIPLSPCSAHQLPSRHFRLHHLSSPLMVQSKLVAILLSPMSRALRRTLMSASLTPRWTTPPILRFGLLGS